MRVVEPSPGKLAAQETRDTLIQRGVLAKPATPDTVQENGNDNSDNMEDSHVSFANLDNTSTEVPNQVCVCVCVCVCVSLLWL